MACYFIAGISKEEDGSGYSVYFPDVPHVCAGGENIEEAIENATHGLHEALHHMAKNDAPLPKPSPLAHVQHGVRQQRSKLGLPYPEDTIYQYVAAPEVKLPPVRVTLTFPKNILTEIDRKAKKAGKSRSAFLADAALAWPEPED